MYIVYAFLVGFLIGICVRAYQIFTVTNNVDYIEIVKVIEYYKRQYVEKGYSTELFDFNPRIYYELQHEKRYKITFRVHYKNLTFKDITLKSTDLAYRYAIKRCGGLDGVTHPKHFE